jgi:peptidyl-prolyl cis-trans isomerase SurA
MTKRPFPLRPAVVLGLLAFGVTVLTPLAAQGLRPTGRAPATPPRPAAAVSAPTPASVAAPAPAAPVTRQADFIVAVVNSEPITNHEVRARMARVEQQMRLQRQPAVPRDDLAREVLERLIGEKSQLQLARESGLKVEDVAVNEAEQAVARQNQIEVSELRRRLAADGIALADFRADLRNQILLQRQREREVDARVRVSESEIDQFIREKTGPTAAIPEINLAMILVAVPEDAPAAQVALLQAKAQRAIERARAGEDFGRLVSELSDARDRAGPGGALGLRPADRYPELFVEATRSLRVGEVAGPVRSGAGFHVLKLLDKRQSDQPAMAVTQSRPRHILLRASPQLSEAAARARLSELRRQILAGQVDFAEAARQQSQDGSAAAGGELGWASPGQFVPEFEEVMNRLAPGEISEPVSSRFGVHLIQMMERRETSVSPREQRELVRNAVRERKIDEAFDLWAREVRGRAYVEMREAPRP